MGDAGRGIFQCENGRYSRRSSCKSKKIPKKDWRDNIQKGAEYFIQKNGFAPGEIPDTDEEEIVSRVNLIKERYSKSEVRS